MHNYCTTQECVQKFGLNNPDVLFSERKIVIFFDQSYLDQKSMENVLTQASVDIYGTIKINKLGPETLLSTKTLSTFKLCPILHSQIEEPLSS